MVNDLLKATEPLGADHASRGKLRILHAEASPEVVRQCSAELDKRGWHPSVVQVDCREEFSRQLWTGAWDLVLASARLRGWNGCEAPEAVRRLRRDIPVILIDGAIGEETVAEALRRGAADYVSTRHLSRLPEVVSRVLRDRSERAEKRRLAEERDRFFMLSTDLLCIFNTRGEILQLNPAWHRSLGFDIEELVKQPLMEWIHPEDRPKFNEAVESLSKGAACTELESRVLSVDGSCRWLQWRASCIPRQPLIYATARDVTETRRLQGQLLQAQRIESIGTLANGIAHDLNNVLTPILMAVDILQEHAVDARALKLLSTVQSSARHGADMVRQILAFSRGMDGEKLPIQLKHLVNKMRDFARDTFPRSIEISSEVATDVCEVLGDATQLHQVLLNLCVNARDAMPGGGSLVLNLFERELEEPYLRLHPDARPGRYAVLSVTDTGTGIPQDPGQDLRTVLHHQGTRERNGTGFIQRDRHREGTWRVPECLQRARQRHPFHGLLSCHEGGNAFDAVARGTPDDIHGAGGDDPCS